MLATEGAIDEARELEVSLLIGSGGGFSSSVEGMAPWLGVEVSAAGLVGFGGACFFSAGEVVDAMLGVLLRDELDSGRVSRGEILVAANMSCARVLFVSCPTSALLDVFAPCCKFSLACLASLSPSHGGGTSRLEPLGGGGRGLSFSFSACEGLSTSTQSSSLTLPLRHGFPSRLGFSVMPSLGGPT